MAEVLRYPYEALTNTTDYLQIDAQAYQSISEVTRGSLVGRRPETSFSRVTDPGNQRGGNDRKNIRLGTVFLPIPSNIQDGNAVGYGDDSLNGIVAGAVGSVGNVLNTDISKGVDQTSAKFKEFGTSISSLVTENSAVKDALNRSLAAQAVSVFGGNVTPDQILARQSGEIFNPNMELLFNGVTLRAFKFQFKLTPRDQNEANEIRNIIRFFKYNMSPQTGTGSQEAGKPKTPQSYFLKTPNVFQLTYKQGSKEHPFLHKFKLCALESMAVNYTGENVYATYGDGTPVSMIMDLSFKELEPIYADDYNTNEKGVGY
jgi:hypothetical protein